MPLVNFWKKFASFPSIFARISKFEHFRGDWAYAEPNLFGEISKKLFFQNVHLGPIRWVPKRFFKILIFYSRNLHYNLGFLSIFKNYSMRMLSIQRNDFIAHWAYEETISLHTEHTPIEFSRMLSQRKNVNSFYMYSYAEHTGKWFIAPWAYEEII